MLRVIMFINMLDIVASMAESLDDCVLMVIALGASSRM